MGDSELFLSARQRGSKPARLSLIANVLLTESLDKQILFHWHTNEVYAHHDHGIRRPRNPVGYEQKLDPTRKRPLPDTSDVRMRE